MRPGLAMRASRLAGRRRGLMACMAVGLVGVVAVLGPGGATRAEGSAVAHPRHAGDAAGVTQHGRAFVNEGLVGTGTLPAGTVDFLGDTLGSFSSLQVQPGSWKRDGEAYEGILWTLPDRGHNDPSAGLFFDYASRLHRFHMRFTPGTGQVELKPDGGLVLRDVRGEPFTGADPGEGLLRQHGLDLPSPAHGTGAGKVSLDAEALQFTRDGGFYVGDEYTANVYYFDAQGSLRGVIRPPAAIEPRRDGALHFGSLVAPYSGRRNNQGVEGLALTPDGTRLFVMLQSALMQDSAQGSASGRINTRLLVYDVRATPTPDVPVAHHVVRLPAYTSRGDRGAPDRTAAQSEIRALDANRLLVLARDGAGIGADPALPVVFKRVLLVDTRGATNLAGTAYESTDASVLRDPASDVLRTGIQPAPWVEAIDLLDPVQLRRHGLHIGMLSEKWEAMDLVPTLDHSSPGSHFLLIGNDNDFIARHCRMSGLACDAPYDNDNRVLVYRVSMPAVAQH